MAKKKMTLKEFAERYECNYSAAGTRLKKLLANDKKFAKHVTSKGRVYLLDDYAAELLKPKAGKRAAVSSSDIEKLKEEQQLLAAKQKEISERIRQTENDLLNQRNGQIAAAVYKALGREYMPGDEIRIFEYLKGCNDFKTHMNSKTNSKTEEAEENNGVL